MDLLHYLHLNTFQPADLLVVLVLVVLEGLLSCDNAVVLALLVKPLPRAQRGKALRYGIIGAYVFRIIALILAVWIMSQWYLKILGGAYLAWLGISYFFKARHDPEVHPPTRRWFGLSPFWSTVVAVELTDIVFSVDSIAAAVALTDRLWILIIGAFLGILAMRYAAQGFVRLLEIFPHLESSAFAAVAFVGLKLLAEFPVDMLGRSHVFAPGTTYATAAAYHETVDRQCPPLLELRHVISMNSAAPPAPEAYHFLGDAAAVALVESSEPERRAQMSAEVESAISSYAEGTTVTLGGRTLPIAESMHREFAVARSDWNLHLRPLLEIEGWVSSLIVIGLFALGFLRRKGDAPA